MTRPTDKQMMDFIERRRVWITYASDLAGSDMQWRVQAAGEHYASPDIRELASVNSFGRTARQAIAGAMNGKILP